MFTDRIFQQRQVPIAVVLGDYRGLDERQSKIARVSRIVLFGALTVAFTGIAIPTGNIVALSAALFFGYKFLKILTKNEEHSFLKVFTTVLRFLTHFIPVSSSSRRYTNQTAYVGGYGTYTPQSTVYEQPYGYKPTTRDTIGRRSSYQTPGEQLGFQQTLGTERDTIGRRSSYQTPVGQLGFQQTLGTERDTIGRNRGGSSTPFNQQHYSSKGYEASSQSREASSQSRDEIGKRERKEVNNTSNERDQIGRR